ncbi:MULTISPECIES: hypothetical protein [Sorangium]|uniref:YkgJ family cysteine cluster protein n=1 Tax=Sorangium atrum TaxID=2995308 RepID=A0ABT5C9S1_9BACT|nr:hypothetical protein [Sorangium aterium]MDC0683173.1 hypothetical protein [Sorangium aterium]
MSSPPANEAPEARPDGSDLCTACGLCCTGLLFDVAPLEEHELPRAEKLRLPLACNRYHDAFSLPCPCHLDRKCTVYEMRFSVCSSYECGLLRRCKSGEVPLGEALSRVERVLRLTDAVRARVPPLVPPRPLWDEAREHLRRRDAEAPSPAWQSERESLVAALGELRVACREGLDP